MAKKKKGVKKKTIKKKPVKKISKKKKSRENKILLGLSVLIGIFMLFGFSLYSQNITGHATLTQEVKDAGSFFINILEPLAGTLLGDVGSGDLLFAKVLFFIIIFGIVYLSLSTIDFFKSSPGISFLINIAISIIAVRWLGDTSVIKTILLPYSAMGIAFVAGLPFIIYFIVINKGLGGKPALVRQTAWIFFAVVFMGLYFTRMSEISKFSWVYPVTALLAGLMAFADGTIQKYFLKVDGQKTKIRVNKNIVNALKQQLAEASEGVKSGAIGIKDYEENVKEIQKKIITLSK